MSTTECPSCHRAIVSGSRFCKFCGAELSITTDDDTIICPQCHTANRPGSRFCKHCGSRLETPPKKDPNVETVSGFDDFIRETTASLRSDTNLPAPEFILKAGELSASILSRAEDMKVAVFSSPEPATAFKAISHIDQAVESCRREFWLLCDRKMDEMRASEAAPRPGGAEVLPKTEWPRLSKCHNPLSTSVYVGKASCENVVFGRTFCWESNLYLNLLFHTNLLVRYSYATEQAGLEFVSSLLGRWLKGSQGENVDLTILDTQDFWGLGTPFSTLSPRVHRLVCNEQDAAQELEKLSQYEQNIIHNRLRPSPSALEFNRIHTDQIPAKVLIIKNFPQDVTSRLDILRRIMRNSAKAGICIVLMVNEDELPVSTFNKGPKEFDPTPWRSDAVEVDFVRKQFPFLPPGASFTPETLDRTDLDWIVDEVNEYLLENPVRATVNVKDFLPDPARAGAPRMNVSLVAGLVRSTFAEQQLILNDMTVGNALLVKGSIDSANSIRNWMQSLALYALTRYAPDSLEVFFCDFSGGNVFSIFANALKNVHVIKKPNVKSLVTSESNTRRLIFAVGTGSLSERDVRTLEGAPRALKRGVHLILEDAVGALNAWAGQKVFFGPASLQDISFTEQEFLLNHTVCRRLETDDDTIRETLASIAQLHPEHEIANLPVASVLVEQVAETTTPSSPLISEKAENEIDSTLPEPIAPIGPTLTDGPLFLRNYLPPRELRWTATSSEKMEIPLGINPWNDKTVNLTFTQSDGQNAVFIIGKPGTGKSSMLHTIILNAAYMYPPSYLQMYLVDLSGVEFKGYATSRLPHARTIAPQAEREFAMCILDEIEKEARNRENLLYKSGQNDFSKVPGLSRILVVIDEFQALFEEDDDIAARSKQFIDRIVKKYRKFGINLILATQKLPSTSRLDSSMINNRIVFDCNHDDFATLFSTGVRQPALGKGECLYTSVGRLTANMEENSVKSFFADVNHVNENGKTDMEQEIEALWEIDPGKDFPPAKVFERDKEVFFGIDRIRGDVSRVEVPEEVDLYLGEPIGPGDRDVAITLDETPGDNVVIAGGLQEVAQGIAINCLLSASDAYSDGSVTCYVFSFIKGRKALLSGSASTYLCGTAPFSEKSRTIPMEELIPFLKEIRDTVNNRMKDFTGVFPHIYLLFLDFQNCWINIDIRTYLGDIFKNGPQCGVFSIVQSSSAGLMKERGADLANFKHRVALQMSREDSHAMIGQSVAGNLNDFTKEEGRSPGIQRALYVNKNQPGMVKIRPYSYRPLIIKKQ